MPGDGSGGSGGGDGSGNTWAKLGIKGSASDRSATGLSGSTESQGD